MLRLEAPNSSGIPIFESAFAIVFVCFKTAFWLLCFGFEKREHFDFIFDHFSCRRSFASITGKSDTSRSGVMITCDKVG